MKTGSIFEALNKKDEIISQILIEKGILTKEQAKEIMKLPFEY